MNGRSAMLLCAALLLDAACSSTCGQGAESAGQGVPAATESQPKAENKSDLKTWTDSTGQFKLDAQFVELKDGKVHLRKQDGKVVAVAVERLSEADQAFAKTQADQKPHQSAAGSPPELADLFRDKKLNIPRGLEVIDSLLLTAPGANIAEKLAISLGKDHGARFSYGAFPSFSGLIVGNFSWAPRRLSGIANLRIFVPALGLARVEAIVNGKDVWKCDESTGDGILSPEITLPPATEKPAELTVRVTATGFGGTGGVTDVLIVRRASKMPSSGPPPATGEGLPEKEPNAKSGPSEAGLRFDGAYVRDMGQGVTWMFRFYENGQVVSVFGAGTVEEHKGNLHPRAPVAYRGQYTLKAGQLAFSVSLSLPMQKTQTLTGRGSVVADRIRVSFGKEELEYSFQQLAFPR